MRGKILARRGEKASRAERKRAGDTEVLGALSGSQRTRIDVTYKMVEFYIEVHLVHITMQRLRLQFCWDAASENQSGKSLLRRTVRLDARFVQLRVVPSSASVTAP